MIIVTSNGHEVMVDDEDYPFLSRWSWFAVRKGNTTYACRNHYSLGGRKERKSKRLYMHLEIVAAPSGSQVDHLDGNGLNNRRENLRCASHEENQRNRGGPQTNNKCGVRGVYWHRQRMKWAASIRVNRKAISLGLHDTLDAAAEARKAAEAKYWSADDMTRVNKQSAAPAAAGAQGEDVRDSEVFLAFNEITGLCRRLREGGPDPEDLQGLSDGLSEAIEIAGNMLAKLTAPQPAAADGGVRERARALLAAEYERDGSVAFARMIREGKPGHLHAMAAIRAIETALSSHRQAGDGLSKFRELAERWRDGVGIDLETRLQCADDLMALVEKGAGNG